MIFIPVIMCPIVVSLVKQEKKEESRIVNLPRFPLLNNVFPSGVCMEGVLVGHPLVITPQFFKSRSGKQLDDSIKKLYICNILEREEYRLIFNSLNMCMIRGTCKGQSITRMLQECAQLKGRVFTKEEVEEYVIFFQIRTILQHIAEKEQTTVIAKLVTLKSKKQCIIHELEITDVVERALANIPVVSQQKSSVSEVEQLSESFNKMCTLHDGNLQINNALGKNNEPVKTDIFPHYDFREERERIIGKRKLLLRDLKQIKQEIISCSSRLQQAREIRKEIVEYAKKIFQECNCGYIAQCSSFNKGQDHKAHVQSIMQQINGLCQKALPEGIILKLLQEAGGHAILVLPKKKQIFDIQHGTMIYPSQEKLFHDLERYLQASKKGTAIFAHCFGDLSQGRKPIPI